MNAGQRQASVGAEWCEWATLLDAGQIQLEAVDRCVLHQSSLLVLKNIAGGSSCGRPKVYSNLSRTGNTVSATVPIALEDASREGRLHPGQTVLICRLGVGHSRAGALLKWGGIAS